VIHLLAQGFSYKQIALQLNISYGTVTSHVYAATQRMGVRTAVQAVALMARAEL
jgi:DNA-binding NarL/FixJ family response regulator